MHLVGFIIRIHLHVIQSRAIIEVSGQLDADAALFLGQFPGTH